MKTRHLLRVRDLSAEEIVDLFRLARQLKKGETPQEAERALAGKTLGLLFHKPSVRTRVSFEVGMTQLGGRAIYLGPAELGAGKREAPKDLARVLSRYLDGIAARTFHQAEVEELAAHANIPVINALSDDHHPCQALADLFTVWEKLGRLQGVRMSYLGDGNNVCHSLLEACALLGVDLRAACPKGYEPDAAVFRWAQSQAKGTGGKLRMSSAPDEAVAGAEVVYTDVWASMGQEKEQPKRKKIFARFQVSSALLKKASPGALFMHCLPAHRGEEVSDEVMDSRRSIVYDQAENRLHVQKAILLRLFAP